MRIQRRISAEHSVLREGHVRMVTRNVTRDVPNAATAEEDGDPPQEKQPTVTVEFKVPPPLADVALVVVHGMGHQRQGQTLLEWAEPILGRIDWLTKRSDTASVARAMDHDARTVEHADEFEPGVYIVDSVMRGATTPHVLVEAKWRAANMEAHTRTIAVVEARWSESFVPMSRAEVFRWGVPFLWRSLNRMFLQFARTMVGIPWFAVTRIRDQAPPTVVMRGLLGALSLVFGAVLTVLSAVVMAVLGVVLSGVLPLLSPLLLIPVVKKFTQSIVDVLVDFVGDVGTFREKPLRAAAMRVVFHPGLGACKHADQETEW